MPSKAYHIRGLVKAVGSVKASEIFLRRAFGLSSYILVNIWGHKLKVRPTNSDLFVLSQIFGWEEYKIDPDHLASLDRTVKAWQTANIKPVIIDAGANVGYSSVYFASLFPSACVIAIEPDQKTFEVLTYNVRTNSNIVPVHAALWSHDQGLQIRSVDNSSWGSQVVEGIGTPSKRLDVLMASIPNSRPLIIKLDIEGAEHEVVKSCPKTFAEAKCILVEPHDFRRYGAACLFPLYKVLASKRFDTLIGGENLMLFALD